MLLKIINLVTYSPLLLGFWVFFLMPLASHFTFLLLGRLGCNKSPASSKQDTLPRDCRVCQGFSPPARCCWESCGPLARGQHWTPRGTLAGKGWRLPLHPVARAWRGRQG